MFTEISKPNLYYTFITFATALSMHLCIFFQHIIIIIIIFWYSFVHPSLWNKQHLHVSVFKVCRLELTDGSRETVDKLTSKDVS